MRSASILQVFQGDFLHIFLFAKDDAACPALSDLLASSRGVLYRGGVGARAMPNWARGFPQQPSQHSPLPWVSTIYYSGLEIAYILCGYMGLAYMLCGYSRQQLPRWGRHPASAFWHFPPNFPPDFRRMSCRTSSPELAARAPQRLQPAAQPDTAENFISKQERNINTITESVLQMQATRYEKVWVLVFID